MVESIEEYQLELEELCVINDDVRFACRYSSDRIGPVRSELVDAYRDAMEGGDEGMRINFRNVVEVDHIEMYRTMWGYTIILINDKIIDKIQFLEKKGLL